MAKYVARIERTGLEPGVLIGMSDAEVMARIAPASRPVNYGGRVKPDFAHLHAFVWNSAHPFLTLKRIENTVVVDLRNGSATNVDLTMN